MDYSKLASSIPPFVHDTPAFVEELRQHKVYTPHKTEKVKVSDEIDVSCGLFLDFTFPDEEGLLATACHDLERFLKEGSFAGNVLPVKICKTTQALSSEEALITVAEDAITLESEDTEGIRHGIYELMDRITASPFLKQGTVSKRFFVKNRISRCFFGPIKRSPYYIDELMNDVDYYPEDYLSRLAREGVNGLWITASFREICKTTLLPCDENRQKRIEKLRKTVEKCRKYGIKTWLFFLEPLDISKNIADKKTSELLRGAEGSFCPRSGEAQQYLYECGFSLFNDVPHLGGIILMSLGERRTSCLNTLPYYHCFSKQSLLRDIPPENVCHKECSLAGSEILSKVVTPIREGMKKASAESELIVQFYMPGAEKMHDEIFDIVDGLPDGTAFVFNYESSVTVNQLGKARTGGDYWLSVPGPSDRFGRMAEKLRNRCEMGAKIQVCCSHELATVPYLPVPAMLYRKYLQMRALDVRHVLQCWYFGNYPGVMNHAAGLLSSEDFSGSEEDFYLKLAKYCDLKDPENVIRAWTMFAHAYSFYPLSIIFQYYGPAHHGIVWPLYLRQVMQHLPQSWLPDTKPAGDAVCECLNSHSLGETAALCRKMSDLWQEGLRIFKSTGNHEDEILYSAINVLLASCADILSFYELRTRLAAAKTSEAAEKILQKMEDLVKQQIAYCDEMTEYCKADLRLGYHSEAEIFKFFPEKIQWRKQALIQLLEEDFPAVKEELRQGRSAWDAIVDTTHTLCQGETASGSLFSVKVEEEAGYKVIAVTLAEMEALSDSVVINLSDPLCAELRYSMSAVIKEGKAALYDPAKAGSTSMSEDGSVLYIRIPASLLPECFRLGLIRSVTDKNGTVHTEGWPLKDAKRSGGLELYQFDPENLALIE